MTNSGIFLASLSQMAASDWRTLLEFDFLEQKVLIEQAAPAVLALLVATLVWLVASRLMRSWRAERLARLQKLKNFAAVPTSSPYDDPDAKARRDAELNVQARFSVMRVVLVVLLSGSVVVLGALPFLGKLPQALLSFLLAITIAIVGVAARPLIENFISGIVLSFSRQLRVGDTVLMDDEHYGTVEDINPTHTIVKLWDWRRYVIPNSSMLQKELVSYTHKDDYLWTHVSFHVTPRANIDEVERLAIAAAEESPYLANFEPPQFWVRELLAESTLCWLAAWAKKPEDAWYLRVDVRKNLLRKLQAAGIDTQLQSHAVKMKGNELEPRTSAVIPSQPNLTEP